MKCLCILMSFVFVKKNENGCVWCRMYACPCLNSIDSFQFCGFDMRYLV